MDDALLQIVETHKHLGIALSSKINGWPLLIELSGQLQYIYHFLVNWNTDLYIGRQTTTAS